MHGQTNIEFTGEYSVITSSSRFRFERLKSSQLVDKFVCILGIHQILLHLFKGHFGKLY